MWMFEVLKEAINSQATKEQIKHFNFLKLSKNSNGFLKIKKGRKEEKEKSIFIVRLCTGRGDTLCMALWLL